MKAIFWLSLGLLNLVGMVLTFFRFECRDLIVASIQGYCAAFCIGNFLSEVKE